MCNEEFLRYSQLSLRSSHSRKFLKFHQKQPSGCIFQYRCSALIVKFTLKNYCDGVRFLVNLHATFSNFEPLLRKFKYFIIALINAEQLLL